jgi:hypothetical protein
MPKWIGERDAEGKPCHWLNDYCCPICDKQWTSKMSKPDDKDFCPSCANEYEGEDDAGVEPYDSIDLRGPRRDK